MSIAVSAEPVPVHADPNGDIRVGDSRVLLDLVVHAFDAGATPETIVQMYSTLNLSDVYAVIAWYLRHRPEVQEYLDDREQRAEETQRTIQSHQRDMSEIRVRLVNRKTQTEISPDAATFE